MEEVQNKMNYFAILIELIASITSAVGSLFLKKGAKKFKIDIIKLLNNYSIVIGAFLAGVRVLL